jgi:glycosyltransferase involved in cell wall biosynthesis
VRIGINTLYMLPNRVGGSEIYLRGLIYGLSKIDTVNEYILFTSKENHESFKVTENNFSKVLCNVSASSKVKRIVYEQLILPHLINKYAIDVLHSQDVTPLNVRCGNVVTILDMQYVYYPNFLPKIKLWYWKTFVPKSTNNAEIIITISNSSKSDIIKYLDATDDKVYVTYLDSKFHINYYDVIADESVLDKIGHDAKYILYVTSLLPHKNIERLLFAFKKISSLIGYHLVLAGLTGPTLARIKKIIEQLDLKHNVVLLGYVSDSKLRALYNNASLFVFPSLFEGFGLPLVEAMNSGCPIAASDRTANAEVVGEAGVLFDPENTQAIADAIYSIIFDRTLAENLIDKGHRRAELFSWANMARTTLQAYSKALELRSF